MCGAFQDAAPRPAPDALALGQALYDAVHYAAERGDVDCIGIVLRPLWDWHVAFVEPGTAIPEKIKAVPIPQPAPAPAADEREALIEVMKTAVNNNPADGKPYSHIADALLAKGYREAAWQPIQTAPRDETAVLICGGTSTMDEYEPRTPLSFQGVSIAFYEPDADDDHPWRGDFLGGACEEYRWHKPTHWMPLPAPFVTPKQGETQ